MNEAYRNALVFVQNKMAGILSETEEGYRFVYLPEYLAEDSAVPVSLTLPLQSEPYESHIIFPFFDGLIPEGWLLNIVIHNWKLNEKDRFGLLLCACKDCIGDVRIEPKEDNI